MDPKKYLAAKVAALAAARSAHDAAASLQRSILGEVVGSDMTEEQRTRFNEQSAEKARQATLITGLEGEVEEARALVAEDEANAVRDAQVTPHADPLKRTASTTVGREERTYGHAEMTGREKARSIKQFLQDAARSAHFNDISAMSRLQRHQEEELVERADWIAERGHIFAGGGQEQRAVGTSAFSGLVVPQYMVDLVAPKAAALRPFADSINQHVIPEDGMTFNISRITTSTATAVQASEGAAAQETDIDDTLLPVSVQTNAGQQSMSRQAVERGTGTDEIMLEDLFKQYQTTLDFTLLNQATNGLSAAAGATVAYTDGTPTAAELYPKILDAASRVEAGGLGLFNADLAVMHSRRWYWLQSQLSSTWPLFGQPNMAVQQGGVNFGEIYGKGFRGVLPNGLAVVVDNNIATNLGAGTNEDEIYTAASDELHLWEDPDAPLLIRTEEVKAATLQILFVVYGYFAYTYARYSAASAKIGGTGLITPVF